VPVTVTGGRPYLAVAGMGWVVNNGVSARLGGSLAFVVPVTSTDSGPRCFIEATVVLKDAAGEVLYANDLAAVRGSLGDNGLDHCLQPGQTGYFVDVDDDATGNAGRFAGTQSIEMAELHDQDIDNVVVPPSVLPTRVEVNGNQLLITVKNFGCEPRKLGLVSTTALLLDDQGPLQFIYPDLPGVTLWPDQEATATDTIFFRGRTDQVRVFVVSEKP
jgi:hypothetical protein